MDNIKNKSAANNKKIAIAVFVVFLIIIMVSAVIFTKITWDRAIKSTETETIQLAEIAVEGMFAGRVCRVLQTRDTSSEDYRYIRLALEKIAQKEGVRFAYIYYVQDGGVFILADSEAEDSEDYSRPWSDYAEADPVFVSVYKENSVTVTGAINDRWGKWISVLVPIVNEEGDVAAVFAIDYPYYEWYKQARVRSNMALAVSICVLLIYIAGYYIVSRNNILFEEKHNLEIISKQLSANEYILRSIFEQSTIGIAIVKGYGNMAKQIDSLPGVNPSFARILDRSIEDIENINWMDITHPHDLEIEKELFAQFKAGIINNYELDKRITRPDGSAIWVKLMVAALKLHEFKDDYYLCLMTDLTNNIQLEQTLRESERSKALLLDNIPGMMYRCKYDKAWTMLYVSEGCKALTGYPSESLVSNRDISFEAVIAEEYRKSVWDEWKRAIKKRKKAVIEYEIITADGVRKWVWEQGQAVYGQDGKPTVLEGIILDITDRKINEIRLNYLHQHDRLTGIGNINLFADFVAAENTSAQIGSRAVILLNVRRYNILKTTFGFKFSQQLIKDIGLYLSHLAQHNACSIFHIASDQFILYIKGYGGKQDLVELCKDIIDNLHKNIAVKALNYNLGVLELGAEKMDAETIIRKASLANGAVGQDGSANYTFFDNTMEEKHIRALAIRQALMYTVNNNDGSLYMAYQPILNLFTGRIAGMEALARYQNDKLGFVAPSEFIPIAEANQLILPMGAMIMRKVFKFAKQLSQTAPPTFFISFNVSVLQLMNEEFYEDILLAINETGVNPAMLHLEMTESIFIDDYNEVNIRLDEIRALGIKIIIDDFGTGYSSLARERELKLDCLKIDKQFIDDLLSGDTNKSIAADIISMAHKLGHSVIAEGIERQEQKDYLIEHHCDMLQGYLYSKPLEADKAKQFFIDNINQEGSRYEKD